MFNSAHHHGVGSKAAPRPGGIGSAAAGQPGMEGDSMLAKILPGGAAEQAGKLGEGKPRTQRTGSAVDPVQHYSHI